MVVTAHASSRNLPVLNAGKKSAKIISDLKIGVGDDFPDPKGNDTIYALDAPGGEDSDTPTPVFPPARVLLSNGERADYLSEFLRAVGGEVRLNRRHHTDGLQLFAGSRALRTHVRTALLDTGSPAYFIQKKVWMRILACGAASDDGLTHVAQKTWGAFHGAPLLTSSHVRLNIHLGNSRKTGRQPTPPSTVCMVVHANGVPDTTMSIALLLARDSWSHFPVRKYRDVSDTETILTFAESDRDLEKLINPTLSGLIVQ